MDFPRAFVRDMDRGVRRPRREGVNAKKNSRLRPPVARGRGFEDLWDPPRNFFVSRPIGPEFCGKADPCPNPLPAEFGEIATIICR